MANYTEQVESHNPALTASGLAVWGWILRITVALSFLVLPYVITTSTMLVDNQTAATALQAIQAAEPYAPSTTAPACNPTPAPASVITGLQADRSEPGPQTLADLLPACNSTHNLTKALTAAGGLTNPQVQGLLAYNPLAKAIQNGQTGEPVRDRTRWACTRRTWPACWWPSRSWSRRRRPRRASGSVGGRCASSGSSSSPSSSSSCGDAGARGRPGATSLSTSDMVTEELAKLDREPAAVS